MRLVTCSVCGFIPTEEDILKTNYKTYTCDTCGQKDVCDLCLRYTLHNWEKSICEKCHPARIIGKNRRFWLQEEYGED